MTHYSIVICDDEPSSLNRSKMLISEYLIGNQIDCSIHTYESGALLIRELKAGNWKPFIIFMDIELSPDNQETGIDIVKELNDLEFDGYIAFLTNFPQYISDVYSVDHTYMILKKDLKGQLPKLFLRLQELDSSKKKTITVSNKGNVTSISLDSIIYAEHQLRTTLIVTKTANIRANLSMNDFEEMLQNSSFVRAHNSFIFNLKHMKSYRREVIIMDDMTEIPVSRKYQPAVRKEVFQWAASQSL